MSISASSRYATSQIIALQKNGQVINVIVLNQPQTQTVTYVSHMVTATDRLDLLANQYYGDPTQWWVIANANPELNPDWTNIEPGTVIRIPFS